MRIENLHSWQKIYTTAGRDGHDKSELWWYPFRAKEFANKPIPYNPLVLPSAPQNLWNRFKGVFQNEMQFYLRKFTKIRGKIVDENSRWIAY